MLKYENIDDRIKMMNYHRTRDMINLMMYFPDISPIRDLTIVEDIEDYKNNYDYCKSLSSERNDTLRSKPSMKSIETSGGNSNIEELFKKVKEIDSDGVIVLFNLSHEPSQRYQRYAGISVGISLNSGVYIDAVGKGFDGREVSKGIVTHERYFIPWFDIRRCNINNFKEYRTYLINDEDYSKSRKDRINFLISVGLDENEVNKNVPVKYEKIPNFIWLDIIKNIISRLEDMEIELKSANLDEIAISGHTEGKRFLPWQMFDKSRYTKR